MKTDFNEWDPHLPQRFFHCTIDAPFHLPDPSFFDGAIYDAPDLEIRQSGFLLQLRRRYPLYACLDESYDFIDIGHPCR